MNDEIEVIESTPTKIRYKDIVWVPESESQMRSDAAMFKTSSAMVSCWLRVKNIKEFNLSDLRESFPKWNHYSRSSLLKIIDPLIKEKRISQCPNDSFKVLNGG